MKIAVPVAAGKLATHFGHCESFVFFQVNSETREIEDTSVETPPAHAPGVLPKWLADRGTSVIIAGGMGSRAINLFCDNGIQVIVGAPAEAPEVLVQQYLAGELKTGSNVCSH